ncbi:type II toxin-antitoxin system RelE/ParE family toxin [Neisseria wadsworthii]|uniref:Addiction module killer protein n=1 Tax=Neisseria wadsworthii 9715 TaxID=1030841 RepID=G4CPJ0_9NEIS|nr:type II toxin-antitoxin system RelE/ParE family toxin [Neisseria wadsworthii]EGZ47753.1 addiction module killer protein [Neisseria wadsworthii 9715]QMT34802.1 type II toxin-antitoxin system RelE/ParE family toxin [Neisseria wadsworthii]
MNIIEQTEHFASWLKSLKDYQAKAAILKRIKRMESGLFGDVKSIKNGLFEMRIDVGQGWRVYYFRSGETVYLLIHGGSKSGQQADIEQALAMKQAIQEGKK